MSIVQPWCTVTLLGPEGVALASWALEGPGPPNLDTVGHVAHLALVAGRFGGTIVLSDLGQELRGLIDLAGLPVEMSGEAEGREEPSGRQRGEEEVHPGDLAS